MNPFFDDTRVQVINLTMDPNDWTALQANYLLNTYYHATFTWNGISENIGVRSHGGGSRSPVKPNLDANFAKYTKTQTFLGVPFVLLKANNEDPSALHEWIAFKLFRKMGLPAPREAPAQVYLNGQLLGFYYIVEHVDETFLERNLGESGGYLYEWENVGDNYNLTNLGTDPSLYANYLNLKTDQDTADLQTFADFVQAINRPSSSTSTDADFIAGLAPYIDPKLFLTHLAIENVLAEHDGVAGGLEGVNNFYFYQFQGQTLYQLVPWDKDLTFSDPARDIMEGITTGININVLAQRLAGIPDYKAFYLGALVKAATLVGGTGGWADQELTREYNVIHDAATNDPNKQCPGTNGLIACGSSDFESNAAWNHTFLSTRSALVLAAAASAGYQPSADAPQIASGGLWALDGSQSLSPGALVNITVGNLGTAAEASVVPLPRVLGGTFVAVDGVRAPLVSISAGQAQIQMPIDLPAGDVSVVVAVNGATSNTATAGVVAAAPTILGIFHGDGTAVTTDNPVAAGQTLSLYLVGLGAVTTPLSLGAAAPTDSLVWTAATPQVSLDGAPMTVAFSGLAPGFIGLYQVNAVVPPTLVQGATARLTLTMGAETESASADVATQ